MRITGIAAEYNPLHNGHIYHIEKARELTEADSIVAVMSGSFTQRGEPAVMDKWTRAKLAVINGIDLVFELPFLYACAPAQIFAAGSVDILVRSGATHMCFGSENGDIAVLREAAWEMADRETEIAPLRRKIMKEGFSFAKANQLAVEKVSGRRTADMMTSPNDILALEYLKRIYFWEKQGRHIEAVTVKRSGSGYYDADADAGFAGATVIRRQIRCDSDISIYVPENVRDELDRFATNMPSDELMFQLVRADVIRKTPDQLSHIYCVGEGLEHKLKKEAVHSSSLDGLVSSVVSRRYTAAAVRRILVYILRGIGSDTVPSGCYGRVLASGPGGRELIRRMKKDEMSEIPVITNVNKEAHRFPEITETLGYDMLAADMYNILAGRDLYRYSDRVFSGHFI